MMEQVQVYIRRHMWHRQPLFCICLLERPARCERFVFESLRHDYSVFCHCVQD